MKLFEIISTPQPKSISGERAYSSSSNFLPIRAAFNKSELKGKVDKLGGGAFADVYQHKNRPGMVMKVGVIGHGRDGYYAFLNHIFRNQRMQSNPYLPRVYNIKTYQVKPNRVEYVIELERLDTLMSTDAEGIQNMGHRLFKDYDSLKAAYLGGLPKEYVDEVEERDAFTALISHVMKKQLSITHVQDKKFREACAIVGNIAKKTGHIVDMHSGNAMIRRTSVGPQLVITDPLV